MLWTYIDGIIVGLIESGEDTVHTAESISATVHGEGGILSDI